LAFLLPRSRFSTACTRSTNKKNQELDVSSRVFRIPEVEHPKNAGPELLDDNPPSSNTPPFLKIIMSRTAAPKSISGHFRPDSAATVKTLTGSTISSTEREIFGKIFDQMLTQPISDAPRKHRFIKSSRLGDDVNQTTPKKGFSLSSASLEDSLFLTTKESQEYPPALRPLAAQFTQNDGLPVENREDWKYWEIQIEACATDFELAKFLETEVFSVMEAHTHGLPPEAGKSSFDTLRTSYSLILLRAMRLFRTTFRNPLAAHTLFLRAKTLSAESYVLGCTTPLYNELLLSRWESFPDLFSISEILDEMSTNGLKGDEETAQILQRIQNDVREWAQHGAEVARVVWQSERDRMLKLERIQKEIMIETQRGTEKIVPQDEIVSMENEVRNLKDSPTTNA
jgi:Mtf2 family